MQLEDSFSDFRQEVREQQQSMLAEQQAIREQQQTMLVDQQAMREQQHTIQEQQQSMLSEQQTIVGQLDRVIAELSEQRQELALTNVLVDTYQKASTQVVNLAFGLIVTATVTIVVSAIAK